MVVMERKGKSALARLDDGFGFDRALRSFQQASPARTFVRLRPCPQGSRHEVFGLFVWSLRIGFSALRLGFLR
jgi:hypothetical protein